MRSRSLAVVCVVAALLVLLAPDPVAAHTESDYVAVPAGELAEVTLRPTHGCDGSPSVMVSTRVPVPGATAEDPPGWRHTTLDDGQGRTVIEWSGGSLPADEVGAFVVSFMVPDDVGKLLVFPFVQGCENGEELAWIDGDPEGEQPAPRLLILPPGSEPAETIDDVPADAPGRDQLVAVIDVDNPVVEDTTTTTEAPTTTSTTVEPEEAAAESDDDDGDGVPWLPIAVGAVVAAGGIAAAVWITRTRSRPG
jgi:uncharacterized protein YcnI